MRSIQLTLKLHPAATIVHLGETHVLHHPLGRTASVAGCTNQNKWLIGIQILYFKLKVLKGDVYRSVHVTAGKFAGCAHINDLCAIIDDIVEVDGF